LLPFSYDEVKDTSQLSIYDLLYKGMYPRMYQYDITPGDFFPSYIQTYIEKDIRQIKNVSDLSLFQKFLKLCAGRTGQILNLSSLGNDCGISYVTAKQWISLLEMSFIVRLLQPHHNNFNKRLVKTPKLYFYDTGIVCSLLNITSPKQLEEHYMKGAIFENFVISELLKQFYNHGLQPEIYFWQDKTGHEVDVILEKGSNLIPIEIKAGQTINSDYFKNLTYWQQLADHKSKGYLVYTGNLEQDRGNVQVISWSSLSTVLRGS
jgi:predicted AAA+ superfamily ATPase